jgi:tetratricopeptide (TPR) repeat protein
MYTQVAEKWLSEQPYLEPVQRVLLEAAAQYYQAFAQQEQTDPVVRREIARASYRLGIIHSRLARHDLAEPAYDHAIALQRNLAAEFPQAPEFSADLARSLRELGKLYGKTDRRPQAEAIFLQVIALWKELLAGQPGSPELLRGLANSFNSLGITYTDWGFVNADPTAYEKAWEPLRQSRELCERLGAAETAGAEDRWNLAQIYHNCGRQNRLTGHLAEAGSFYRRALNIWRSLVAESPHSPRFRFPLANTLVGLGESVWLSGRPQEAEVLLQEALEQNERLANESPEVPEYRARIADTLDSLATYLPMSGRDREAVDARRRIVAIFESLRDEFPTMGYENHVTRHKTLLGMLLATSADRRVRNPREALQLVKGTIISRPLDGENWNALGIIQYRLGAWGAAIEALERSVELRGGGDASDWFFLAMAHCRRGENEASRDCYKKAIAWLTANSAGTDVASWMAKNKPDDWHLRRYRAEAAALLGLDGQSSREPLRPTLDHPRRHPGLRDQTAGRFVSVAT